MRTPTTRPAVEDDPVAVKSIAAGTIVAGTMAAGTIGTMIRPNHDADAVASVANAIPSMMNRPSQWSNGAATMTPAIPRPAHHRGAVSNRAMMARIHREADVAVAVADPVGEDPVKTVLRKTARSRMVHEKPVHGKVVRGHAITPTMTRPIAHHRPGPAATIATCDLSKRTVRDVVAEDRDATATGNAIAAAAVRRPSVINQPLANRSIWMTQSTRAARLTRMTRLDSPASMTPMMTSRRNQAINAMTTVAIHAVVVNAAVAVNVADAIVEEVAPAATMARKVRVVDLPAGHPVADVNKTKNRCDNGLAGRISRHGWTPSTCLSNPTWIKNNAAAAEIVAVATAVVEMAAAVVAAGDNRSKRAIMRPARSSAERPVAIWSTSLSALSPVMWSR